MHLKASYPKHFRAILRLGLPLIGGHLAHFAIGLTDTVMMGWHSVAGLAALVLGNTLFFILFIMGSGFAAAVMPLVASADAQGDQIQVRRITRMGFWLSALFGLLAMPVFWWSSTLLQAFGQQASLADEAQRYLRIAGFAIVPGLLMMVVKSYLAGLEKTQAVLWIIVAGVGLNIVLNYAFIFGHWGAPELGIQGAGVASLIVNLTLFMGVVLYAAKTSPKYVLFHRLWKLDWDVFGLVARMGVPIAVTSLAETGLFAASAIMMGWLGTVPLAAHGIAQQLTAATFMIHLGLSNTATIRAGTAMGRQDQAHLLRGARAVIAVAMVVVALTVYVFLAYPHALIGLFLDAGEMNRDLILQTGTTLLAVAALFQLVDSGQVMALGLLRGVQDAGTPMVIAAVSYWMIGIPAAYYMGFVLHWQGAGIWLGLVVGLAIAAMLLMARFWLWSCRIAA
ncbi:MAG: MATE family efflux transporter [Paracoccaceae bacterium]|nr:MATE family efflux transporter [Paracoccaceae bacterium]